VLAVALAVHPSPALAFGDFLCAGPADGRPAPSHLPVAGKLSQAGPRGIQALVLFAGFSDTDSEQARLPDWSSRLFDLDHPGSFSHFFRTMSFDGFQPRGQVAPSQYLSRQAVSFYVSSDSNKPGSYGQFSRDILSQADGDLDFALFDSDGPDGIANSGDDDGVVDAVFIILDRVPLNFLQGAATGVASLGLDEDWLTDDVGADGHPIRIASPQGVVLQGRTFAETAGVMCHEYGHVLGLPDLFNTAFVQEKDAGPADDSAGIGNWGLMGWGATGWHGDDGPNSFSAWSRMKLGWTLTREISQAQEELRLPEIGSSGDVYSIPLGAGEFFLLEHRRNTSTHYDRNIPGEGLLIWHVDHDGPALESADGRWLDAGFPDGRQPDQDGGDNLDFWAHDGAYSDRHAGNKGDATDPFDGERFNAFTAETNPAAYNSRRSHSIQIEDIHIDGDVAVAHVRTQPAVIELFFPRVSDASKDGILTADEEGQVYFHVVNRGGLVARNVRVSLTTEEPLLEVIQADAFLGDIQVGRASARPVDGGGFPRIRLGSDFSGTRPLEMSLELSVDGVSVGTSEFQIDAVFSFLLTGRVTDSRGNGLPNIGVSLFLFETGNQRLFTVITYVGGSFEHELPPGPYFYSTDARGADYAAQSGPFQMRGDASREITLLDAFPVSGTVTDSSGTLLVTASVGARWRTGLSFISTSADGGYTLMLPRGRHAISADRFSLNPDRAFPTQVFESIQVDGPRRFDMVLAKGVVATVHVVDPMGAGVGGLALLPTRSVNVSTPPTTADLQGVARLNLIPEVYRIHASFGPPANRPPSLPADRGPSLLSFV